MSSKTPLSLSLLFGEKIGKLLCSGWRGGLGSCTCAFGLIQKTETLTVVLKARNRDGAGSGGGSTSVKNSQKGLLHSQLVFP